MELSRRHFLACFTVALAGIAGTGLVKLGLPYFNRIEKLPAYLAHRRLGAAYRNTFSPPPAKSYFERKLESKLQTYFIVDESAVRQTALEDFKTHKTVEINGWIMPKTLLLLSAWAAS